MNDSIRNRVAMTQNQATPTGNLAFTGRTRLLTILADPCDSVQAPHMINAELAERGISADASIAWSVRYAPFLHEWPAALRQVRDARKSDVKEIFGQRGTPSRTIEGSRALRIVAVWWWVLPVARIPRWIGAAISAFLIGLGWFCVRRAFQVDRPSVELGERLNQ